MSSSRVNSRRSALLAPRKGHSLQSSDDDGLSAESSSPFGSCASARDVYSGGTRLCAAVQVLGLAIPSACGRRFVSSLSVPCLFFVGSVSARYPATSPLASFVRRLQPEGPRAISPLTGLRWRLKPLSWAASDYVGRVLTRQQGLYQRFLIAFENGRDAALRRWVPGLQLPA